MANQPSQTFIGRQSELAVLTAALDDALAGRGQIVMLAGEPGIGKTRLAQELASLAESLGALVMWGWCYEHTGAPPYWPYVQPIRAYVEMADAQQLRAQMGPGAGHRQDPSGPGISFPRRVLGRSGAMGVVLRAQWRSTLLAICPAHPGLC